jgi:hypothetical protein
VVKELLSLLQKQYAHASQSHVPKSNETNTNSRANIFSNLTEEIETEEKEEEDEEEEGEVVNFLSACMDSCSLRQKREDCDVEQHCSNKGGDVELWIFFKSKKNKFEYLPCLHLTDKENVLHAIPTCLKPTTRCAYYVQMYVYI